MAKGMGVLEITNSNAQVIENPFMVVKTAKSNGGKNKYSDVYWYAGDKDSGYTINLVPALQSPTKGQASGKEAGVAVVQHVVASKNNKFQLCNNETGIWCYQLEGSQKIGQFYINKGGEEMDLKEIKAVLKAVKLRCVMKQDATVITDPIAHLYK